MVDGRSIRRFFKKQRRALKSQQMRQCHSPYSTVKQWYRSHVSICDKKRGKYYLQVKR